jgi:uncharacterized protein (TIGR03437 family)
MKATKLSYKRTAFLLTLTLLLSAAAYAQTPEFNLNGTNSNAIAASIVSTLATNISVASATAATNITYNVTTSYAGDTGTNPYGVQWLCVNGQSGSSCGNVNGLNTPNNLSLSIVGSQAGSALLTNGTHTAAITLTPTDSSGASPATITVSYTPGATIGGSSAAIVANPVSLNVSTSFEATGLASFTVSTTSTSWTPFTVSTKNAWISLNPLAGTVILNYPEQIGVTILGGLAPLGLNNGNIVVSSGANSFNIPVTFQNGVPVTGTGPLSVTPNPLSGVYASGSSTFPSASVIFNGNSGVNYAASASSSNGWLLVNGQTFVQTVPSSQVTISTNSNLLALAAGAYTGTVSFIGGDNSSAVLTVNITVTPNATGIIIGPPNPITFSAPPNGTAQTASVPISSQNAGTMNVSISGAGLSVAPQTVNFAAGGATSVTITADPTGLSAQTYSGQLMVGAAGNTLTAPVDFTVVSPSGSGGGSGSLNLSTPSFVIEVAANSAPTSVQLGITAGLTTSFAATATTANCGNWLSISPAGSLTTPQTIILAANPAGLSPQTCTGAISLITQAGTQTASVTMTVDPGPPLNALNIGMNGHPPASSPSLSFTANAVGATVPPQYLTVTRAAGSSTVSFTASLSGSSCGWVQLEIAQGQVYQTPLNPLNVGATTGTLAAGTYTCALILAPMGGTAQTVPLTLTISGPTITVPATPLMFSYAGGAAPVAQTATITATGASPASFTATATSTPSGWLSVSPASGQATAGSPGMVTVSVNTNGLAAGTYSGSVSIAAGAGTMGSGTIPVTLTVTAPTPNITAVMNSASFLGGSISPGELISIFGTNIGPPAPLGPSIGSGGTIGTTQGNVQLFFGTVGNPLILAAPLTYVSSTQINCAVPYEASGQSSVTVTVKYLGQTSNTLNVNVGASAPGIFSVSGKGGGQGAILNQDSTPNTPTNPAAKNSLIQIFMTGEGVTSPPGVDGSITRNSITVPVLPVAVTIGGEPATVSFKGEAPGLIAGILQLNVTIPPTVPSGANQVQVTIGGNSTQANLTVAVQ